jgi:lipase ATG15
MITGAQTEIPSIGVSGPNNMLSRMTFDPPVSADALIDFTFNIVPDRDPVPSIDDLAQNYQRIKCRAEHTTIAGCHKINRSLCEILYTCGSEGRPIPCFCVNNYDFDPPRSINGKNFSDYCTDK